MPWAAAAAVGSAVIGSDASRKAGNAQADAARESLEEQRRQFDLLRGDQEPYREAGKSALEQLKSLMTFDPSPDSASVMREPGYQFGLDQGRNALEGSAAARGGLYSGQALKELTQFGNDYGTTKFGQAFDRQQTGFGNRWNRLAGLAGIGQTATQATGAAGMNFANQASNLMTGAGNAQAAAGMSQANIWGNGLSQLGGFAANKWGQPSGSTYTPGSVDDSGNGWW